VIARDHNTCVKCRRRSRLEVHHVIPVVYGGNDLEENLITLCRECHDNAPDEPADFFRWAASGLPPEMDGSKYLSRVCVSIIAHRVGLPETKIAEALDLVDEIYPDLWRVLTGASDETNRWGDMEKFWRKYFPQEARKRDAERRTTQTASSSAAASGSDPHTTDS
jgi:hypothetical protein